MEYVISRQMETLKSLLLIFRGKLIGWNFTAEIEKFMQLDYEDEFEEINSLDFALNGEIDCVGLDNCILILDTDDNKERSRCYMSETSAIAIFCSNPNEMIVATPCSIEMRSISDNRVIASREKKCESPIRMYKVDDSNGETYFIWDTFDIYIWSWNGMSDHMTTIAKPDESTDTPYIAGDISDDGSTILSGYGTGDIYALDVESQKIIKQFKGHTQSVIDVKFSPSYKHILSASFR